MADEGTVTFFGTRGTFYRVPLSEQVSAGIYGIDELNRLPDTYQQILNDIDPTYTGGYSYNATSPILIMGVDIGQTDITNQAACLSNAKVLYTFGRDFGQISVSGEVLLGGMGDIRREGVDRLNEFFWRYRVSEYKFPITIAVGESSYKMYLTGMKIGAVDPEYHVMPFILYGVLLDLNADDLTNINPDTTVLGAADLNNPSILEALRVRSPQPAESEEDTEATQTQQIVPASDGSGDDVTAEAEEGAPADAGNAGKGAAKAVSLADHLKKLENEAEDTNRKLQQEKTILVGLEADMEKARKKFENSSIYSGQKVRTLEKQYDEAVDKVEAQHQKIKDLNSSLSRSRTRIRFIKEKRLKKK